MDLLIFSFYILITFCFLSTLSINYSLGFPVYKVILTENINNLDIESYQIFNCFINLKGIVVKFDNTSKINVIPMHLFKQIKEFYSNIYYNYYYFQTRMKNEYIELILNDFYDKLEILHLILEDRGIKIPLNELFTKKENSTEYSFLFLGKEDEDTIIFGKDLIKTMDIEFKDNNYYINNDNFIIKVEEN